MPTPLLTGEYDLTIDDKNRLSIPSEVRKAVEAQQESPELYLFIGRNKKPWLMPEKLYLQLAAGFNSDLAMGDAALAFYQLTFAMANKIAWDKQGRILLPEKNLKRTGLGKEITMTGVFDHLELWNREEWESQSDYLIDNRTEITERARQSMGPKTF